MFVWLCSQRAIFCRYSALLAISPSPKLPTLPANLTHITSFCNTASPPAAMNSRRHSTHRSPKGKEPARSDIIDLSESPVKKMPSSNASNETNMGNRDTCTGANMTPLGTGSEASSSKAGAAARTRNPFTPSSLSTGPRPNRGHSQPHLPVFSSNDFPQAEVRSRPNSVCIIVQEIYPR